MGKAPAELEFGAVVLNASVPVVADASVSPALNPATVPVKGGNGVPWKIETGVAR